MKRGRPVSKAVSVRRALIELRLLSLLQEVGSTAPLGYIKQLIFEARPTDFSAYLTKMLEILDSGGDTTTADTGLVRVIQDAWNYFPHRSLDGHCPAELVTRERSVLE